MRILDAHTVRRALDMKGAIEAVRQGFIALSAGRAIVPLRSAVETGHGVTLYMPAYLQGEPYSAVKIVSVFPRNPERGLPTINAAVLVLDAQSGQLLALLDGTYLTALRTGAASGLATDLLARPEARTLGVIGAGAQARTQVEAVCAVRPIETIRIYSLSGAEALAEEARRKSRAQVMVAGSAHEALAGADVVVAATNSRMPVVHLADLSPGVHINGIGSFTPEMQEVAADVVARAKIVVDHRPSVWAEAGDLIQARDQGFIKEEDIYAEIGEIAAGQLPGRTDADEITFFKSVGNAVQDAAVAARVLAVAEAHRLGVEVAL